ncbi:MAG TPA: SCO family protein [Gemmatimonadales bacterium]|nr:SCO family protein [Gemmatimonadales bacterium]
MLRRRPQNTVAPLALAAIVLLAACGGPTGSSEQGAITADSGASAQVARQAPSDFSVYELESSWHDANDAEFPLSKLAGRRQVLAMVYTTCTATCPITVAQMKRMEEATGSDLGFVLVSLDPQRDDAERLAQYAGDMKLDESRWTLLTGPDDDVRALAAVLGIRYRQVTPDDIAHSNILTVLDEEGRITYQQMGFGGIEETIAYLNER